MTNSHANNVAECAAKIREAAGELSPKLAIVLGSGLGGLADALENPVTVPYTELPGFPVPSVAGHAGELIIGTLGGTPIICLKGRVHLYETHDFFPLKTMIRSLQRAKVETLFVTNAAGSLNLDIARGQIMAISDHINFLGINPLIGPNEDEFGPRFPDMNDVWSTKLRNHLHACADRLGVKLHEGVYIAFRGPSFETPAEIRMAQAMGGDAVGMSSVPEAIIARHCGIRTLGCSVITNLGAGLADEELSHEHTFEGAAMAAENLVKLVTEFATTYADAA